MKGPNELKPVKGIKGVLGIPEKNEIKAARPPKDVRAVKAAVAPRPKPRPGHSLCDECGWKAFPDWRERCKECGWKWKKYL